MLDDLYVWAVTNLTIDNWISIIGHLFTLVGIIATILLGFLGVWGGFRYIRHQSKLELSIKTVEEILNICSDALRWAANLSGSLKTMKRPVTLLTKINNPIKSKNRLSLMLHYSHIQFRKDYRKFRDCFSRIEKLYFARYIIFLKVEEHFKKLFTAQYDMENMMFCRYFSNWQSRDDLVKLKDCIECAEGELLNLEANLSYLQAILQWEYLKEFRKY